MERHRDCTTLAMWRSIHNPHYVWNMGCRLIDTGETMMLNWFWLVKLEGKTGELRWPSGLTNSPVFRSNFTRISPEFSHFSQNRLSIICGSQICPFVPKEVFSFWHLGDLASLVSSAFASYVTTASLFLVGLLPPCGLVFPLHWPLSSCGVLHMKCSSLVFPCKWSQGVPTQS